MSDTYRISDGVLEIYTRNGVRDYCRENKIRIENFDMAVRLDESMVDCSEIFRGCYAFNNSVNIAKSAKNCSYMFCDCRSFNQPVTIPEGVEDCYAMFMNCRAFNQNITVPKSVKICSYMFANCSTLSYFIEKPSGAKFWKMHIGCDKIEVKTPFISAEKLEVSKSEMIIPIGETRTLRAILSPAKCSARVKFVIDNKTIADGEEFCFEHGTDYRLNISGKASGKTTVYSITDKMIYATFITVE